MCSLSSYKQRERRECGYSRRFYRLNVYTTNLYPPTGALDSKAAGRLLGLFGEINREGQTILMVTHSVQAASHAGRILFIRDGCVFHQIYRGNQNKDALYRMISDTLTVLQTQGTTEDEEEKEAGKALRSESADKENGEGGGERDE